MAQRFQALLVPATADPASVQTTTVVIEADGFEGAVVKIRDDERYGALDIRSLTIADDDAAVTL